MASPPTKQTLVSMARIRSAREKGRILFVVGGVAYDFTDFASEHPGGPEYLRKNSGKVADEEFVASHPIDIIERTLTEEQMGKMMLGAVDPATLEDDDVAKAPAAGSHQIAAGPTGAKPTIESCINIFDFEAIARETVPQQGWVYYSSGADDEITLRENHSAFQRIWMRPRVLVNVREVDTSTTILGRKTSMPLMLCAVAMCKLGHPDGECAWAGASKEQDVPYMVPTLSGCAFEDIMKAGTGGNLYFQLYVNQDRRKTKKIVQRAEAAGCTALYITVDAPQLGNREKDRRVKVSHSGAAVQSGTSVKKSEGTAKALTTFIDPSLCWDDLDWFAGITSMKIVLKGIASAEDAIMALEHGKVAAIMLSNHGGRQLDGARSAIEILPEVMAALRAHPKYERESFEVYIDGGLRRGTDIYKALALGATAVGIGRPALYAMSAFGQEGVEKCISIFRSELEMTMRLMGTKSLKDIKETSVVTTDLARHYVAQPFDHLSHHTYQPKVTQALKNRFRRAAPATAAATHPTPATAAATAAATATAAIPGSAEFWGLHLLRLLWVMVENTLLRPVIGWTWRTSLHRSALFLLAFLVVHAAGNMTVFLGPDAFNAYGDKLMKNPLIRFIEWYLLLAAVTHALTATYATYQKRRFIKKSPAKNGVLALSAMATLLFVVVHLMDLRFAEYFNSSTGKENDENTINGVRDIYALQLQLFRSPLRVAFYEAGVTAVGVHLWYGWAKSVPKMNGVPKEWHRPFLTLGYGLLVLICAAFAACPLYMWYVQRVTASAVALVAPQEL